MLQSKTHSNQSFSSLGVNAKLTAILHKLNFVMPTPIQAQVIPVARTGRDVIGIAQTGTGKTLAFTVPMIERIAHSKKQGLIVVPTRELAEQVAETLVKVGQTIGLRQALIIGGASMERQVSAIRRRPHVIVGTPGRINDHLERGSLKFPDVGIVVLDEADRMFDMGFAPQVQKILQRVPSQRQTMLFSATMPPAIASLASRYLVNPARIQVTPAGTVAQRVKQELFIIPQQQKSQLLDRLLSDHKGTVLVFSRTKYGAKKICRAVRNMNHAAAEIHSNLSPSQRRRSLASFRSGAARIMVATDIASRGIDVSDIELVINYDLPDQLEDYVHRVGRTGRAGKQGKAISFVSPDQSRHIRTLERLVRQKLVVSPLPELPVVQPVSPVRSGRRRALSPRRPPRKPVPRRHRFQPVTDTHGSPRQHRAKRPRIIA